MACGVPCVVTDIGDSRELVGDTGVTVPPGKPEALAAAWAEMLMLTPEERQRMGQAARRRVRERYSLERIADDYAAVYRKAAGSRRAG
jgi:glycosyltransferase involved in cell wall biosynthesis